MSEMILKPARWKVQTTLFIAFVASIFGALGFLGTLERFNFRDGAVFSMISVVGFVHAYFASGRYLRFSKDGFEVKEHFRRSRYTSWSEVDQIGIAGFPSSAEGRLSYHNFAGVKFRDDTAKALTDDCRRNRKECGYDLLMEPNYGLSLERFVATLKRRKHGAEKK